jgi:hypothetical protein
MARSRVPWSANRPEPQVAGRSPDRARNSVPPEAGGAGVRGRKAGLRKTAPMWLSRP